MKNRLKRRIHQLKHWIHRLKRDPLFRTRLSLTYLAGYLLIGGAALLIAPQPAIRLFLATGNYSDLMLRLVGGLLVALCVFVSCMIAIKAEKMYPMTLLVRCWILLTLGTLYSVYGDPFLLVLLAIVGIGCLLTGVFWFIERRSRDAGDTDC